MKKLNKLSFLIVLLSLITFSCTEDDQAGYQYDGTGSRIYGFQNPTTNYSYFADIGVVAKEIPVVFIGGSDGTLSTTDTTFTYEVDTAASTAIEGVEFDFVDTTGELLMPAGQNFTMFPLNVNTGNFNPTTPTKLVLNLTSANNGSVISTLNRTVTISFIGCQSTLDAFLYDVTVVREDGAVGNMGIESIFSPSVNVFQTESTGLWGAGVVGGYEFTDVCGVLEIAQQGLDLGTYSNQVYTTTPGSVAANGDFTITYAITFSGSPTFYTATYIKQ